MEEKKIIRKNKLVRPSVDETTGNELLIVKFLLYRDDNALSPGQVSTSISDINVSTAMMKYRIERPIE